MSLRVLVVDDERLIRVTTARQLAEAGFPAEGHETAFSALNALEQGPWDVVLTDLRMPHMDGLQFLAEVRKRCPSTAVILMTAYGTVETAVRAMREGAEDYLTKPFTFEELRVRLERVAERLQMRRELASLRQTLSGGQLFCGMAGVSASLRKVFEQIEQFADNPANVLIIGETGTGKELVARALHERGANAKGPFVALACGAVPRELAESELFGHEAGAFTGAVKRRKGRFELAGGGTLFLDDVDDLPLDLQPKLLRAIESRTFERVGGEETLRAAARVVAATKADLGALVQQGRFREDLYYRLRVLCIQLPPLRERPEDILPLAQHFLEMLARQQGAPPRQFSPAAAEALRGYAWPGNVRELRHAIEYAQTVAREQVLQPADLPGEVQPAPPRALFALDLAHQEKVDLKALSEQFERELIQWALRKAGGNQGRAAELLGLPRTTLQSRLGGGEKT